MYKERVCDFIELEKATWDYDNFMKLFKNLKEIKKKYDVNKLSWKNELLEICRLINASTINEICNTLFMDDLLQNNVSILEIKYDRISIYKYMQREFKESYDIIHSGKVNVINAPMIY